MSKVWFITGCSTGFGRNIALEVLKNGNRVAVASRNTDDVKDIIVRYPDTAIAIKLDFTNNDQIKTAVGVLKGALNKIAVLQHDIDIWEETTERADNPPSLFFLSHIKTEKRLVVNGTLFL